jgi:hypothetical protein
VVNLSSVSENELNELSISSRIMGIESMVISFLKLSFKKLIENLNPSSIIKTSKPY